MKNLKTLALALITIVLFAACSDDDKPSVFVPVNEEEVITTITTTLTNGSSVITLTSRDIDGDGPDDPVVTVSGPLAKNTTYTGSIVFLNELATPTQNITDEIEEEGHEHQVFYQIPTAFGNVSYTDADVNGKPIGLQFTLTTSNTIGTSNLVMTLVHEPNKDAAGVSSGDVTNAGGATDAQVVYPIEITD